MKSNTKKIGLFGLLLSIIIGTSFLDNDNNLNSENYKLNNQIISQVKTDKYLQRKEAQNMLSSLGLDHKILYDSVKFNFYSLTNENISVNVEYRIPERQFSSLKFPIGNVNRKTLQHYLDSQK